MSEFSEITRPYPGLRPFESWEGEIFFGREEHTNRLLDILQQQRFLATIGPSGSGKSSLVRAGLLPALPLGSLGTGSDWRIAVMRPGNRPLQRLAHVFLKRSALGIELVGEERIPQNDGDLTPDAALIEAELRRGPLGLIEVVKDARTRQINKEPFNLLVLVDQFEEIFTYADAGEHQADESEAFVNLLLAPRMIPDARIYIVLTMRTDFLGNCVRFLELPDAINRAQYLTPRLTREQIERAITNPAYLFNGDVEPMLVTELINAVSNDPDQLPILQHALARMWDKAGHCVSETRCIKWDDFNAIGGIANALSLHADEILATLSPRKRIEQLLCPEQQAGADLFRAITEQRGAEAGGQAVRRPQSLACIAEWSGRKWQDFKPVINAYAKEGINFLHFNAPLTSDSVIDISHEALIRQWKRLRLWVKQETRLASEYKRWRSRAEHYKNGRGDLLMGADLVQALEWRDGHYSRETTSDAWKPNQAWADRYKTQDEASGITFNEVINFINDSHAVVLYKEKRDRFVKWALIALTVISVLATIGAFGFAWQSHNRQITTEAELLWTPLDFSSPTSIVTEKQAVGLSKLALAEDSRKWVFLIRFLTEKMLAERFINNPEAIMTALVGINPERRNEVLRRINKTSSENVMPDVFRVARLLLLSELGGNIILEDIMSAITITDTRDLAARKILGQRIKTIVAGMTEAEREAMGDKFLTSLKDTKIDYEAEPRTEGLTEIIRLTPETRISRMAEKIVAAIKESTNPIQLDTLKKSLMAVAAAKMPKEQEADGLAIHLITAMKKTTDPGQFEALEKGLEEVAAKMSETQAGELAIQILAVIKVREPMNAGQVKVLGNGLAAMAKIMPESQAGTLADQLFTGMKESLDPGQFDALGQGLAAVAVKMSEPESEEWVNRIVAAIKNPNQFKIIGQGPDNDFNRFKILGQALAAVALRLPEAQAGTLAYQLFAAMKKPMDPGQFEALGQGLEKIAAKMPQSQAGALANQLFTATKDIWDSRQFAALGKGLTAAAKNMSESQARGLAIQIIRVMNELKMMHSSIRFITLGKELEAVTGQVPESQARALTTQLITEILDSENRMRTIAFGYGLAKVAANIPEAQAGTQTNYIISLFKDSNKDFKDTPDFNKDLNDTQFNALGKGLEGVVKKLPEHQAEAIALQLIAAIKGLIKEPKDERDRSKIKTLGKGLAAVSGKVPEVRTGPLTEQFIAAINESEDPSKNEALGHGLAALFAKTSETQAGAFADKLVAAMQDTKSPGQFKALGQGLLSLAKKLHESQKIPAERLVNLILQTQASAQLQTLGLSLTTITSQLKSDEATAVLWFETLKDPLAPRSILASVIRQRFVEAPPENQGFWNLIEWAEKRFPSLDLEAPYKEPSEIEAVLHRPNSDKPLS